MPSHLRLQSTLDQPIDANALFQQTSPTLPPKKKQRMSLTSVYQTASTARSKLGREANRADHNLRRLVGHANLLDELMIELQDAEREQEAWFNSSVRSASKPEEPRRVQWIDTITEEMDVDSDSDEESDDGSDVDEDEEMLNIPPLRKIRSPPVTFSSADLEDDEEDLDGEYDEDSEDTELTLVRSPSKHSCPQLTVDDEEDSDSESEDECPSPENTVFQWSEKQRKAITTTTYYDIAPAQPQATMIAAAC